MNRTICKLFSILFPVAITLYLLVTHHAHLQYQGLEKIERFQMIRNELRQYKLLIATSLGSREIADYVQSMRSYRHTNVKFALNCYEGNTSREYLEVYLHEAGLSDHVISISTYPGAKTLFWKHQLDPVLVSKFDILWLMDSDMAFDLKQFQLETFLRIAIESQASIFQPAIHGFVGKKSSSAPSLRSTSKRKNIQETCFVEVMTPFFHTKAWANLYHQGLAVISNDIAVVSSWGIDVWWCHAITSINRNNSRNPADRAKPSCAVVYATPITHKDTKTMPSKILHGKESRYASVPVWRNLMKEKGLVKQCQANLGSINYWLNLSKSSNFSISFGKPTTSNKTQPTQSWRDMASRIYTQHYSQDNNTVEQLNTKWNNRTLIGLGSPWVYWQLLKNVTDHTDNSLLNMSQWIHVLQVYEAMKLDNITSPKALFLALMHDFGKVLLLFDIDESNVCCSTKVLGKRSNKKGLDNLIVTWNHDEFGYQKLKSYIPPDMAWAIRYHSLSALLRGQLNDHLTVEEMSWFPLLRTLWKYDHMYKSPDHIPKVDLQEVRSIIQMFLPGEILL